MQAQSTPQRKYALSKIAPGDYLLPSNDGRTIWRISKYTEGPSSGIDLPRDQDFWAVWKWSERVAEGGCVDTADWSRWEFQEGMLDTRAEAVSTALRLRP